jgi:hypothetical protein
MNNNDTTNWRAWITWLVRERLLDKDAGVVMIALWDAFKSTDVADMGADATKILPYQVAEEAYQAAQKVARMEASVAMMAMAPGGA